MNKFNFLGDQEKCFNDFQEFLTTDDNYCLIEGFAGSGKTYLVQMLIQNLLSQGYDKIGMLAPTAQAVRVCKTNSEFYDSRVHYSTIHSAFAIRPIRSEGKQIFKQNKAARKAAYEQDIIFIDECSQIEDKLFDYINDLVEDIEIKVVLIGDKFQIPPIGQVSSIPFDKKSQEIYNFTVLQLNQPIRQKVGNPILDNADLVRKEIAMPLVYLEEERVTRYNSLGQGVEFLKENKFKGLDLLRKWYLSEEYSKNQNFIKVIAWHREEVRKWNNAIRKVLYENDPNNLNQGKLSSLVLQEKIRSEEPFVISTGIGMDRIVFSNNSELVVESFTQQKYEILDNVIWYRDTNVSYIDDYGDFKNTDIKIVNQESKTLYTSLLKHLAKLAKSEKYGSNAYKEAWKEFYAFNDMFLNYEYNYAITGHKSQGSTYDNTIVIESDINTNPTIRERNQILYVAITRAKNINIQIYSK